MAAVDTTARALNYSNVVSTVSSHQYCKNVTFNLEEGETSMSDNATATKVSASGKTGGICAVSGPYKCASSVVVFFKKGDTFSADPATGKATVWTM